jgi:hypothetical protein
MQASDLSDAIRFASEAVEATPPEDPLKEKYTVELCELLCERALWNADVTDADKAVDIARQQLKEGAMSTATPGIRGILRRALISSLTVDYRLTGKEEYVNEALRELGFALQYLSGETPVAQKLFGPLRKAYADAGAEGIVLPSLESPDPFQPFFDCLLFLGEELFSSFQKFFDLFWDPDLMEQLESLTVAVISIILHYQKSPPRLSVALTHCLALTNFTTSVLEWFRGLTPKTHDVEKMGEYMEVMAGRAETYITLGDVLWGLGREEEAREKWEVAKRDLEEGKENIHIEMAKRCLRSGMWHYCGSKFVEFNREWLEGKEGKGRLVRKG